jgi:hypothetical protein
MPFRISKPKSLRPVAAPKNAKSEFDLILEGKSGNAQKNQPVRQSRKTGGGFSIRRPSRNMRSEDDF